jgi:hypothetical protein
MNYSLLQNGHLFLPVFPQSNVGTTAISMAFTPFFFFVYCHLSSEEHSSQCIVQYDHDVWQNTVFSHVQECDTNQFNPVSWCNSTGALVIGMQTRRLVTVLEQFDAVLYILFFYAILYILF